MTELLCICLAQPMTYDRYVSIRHIGMDTPNFGEANIRQCRQCERYWLHYLIEDESMRGSGRYFMGLISREQAEDMKPNEAAPYLASLEWHLYGGSYFGGDNGRYSGPLYGVYTR